MKIIKRNQVVILVIALMLVTAGYLNFIETNSLNENISTSANSEQLGDATFVSSSDVVSNKEEEKTDTDTILDAISSEGIIGDEDASNITEADTSVSVKDTSDEYFTNSKLDRDTMYSQIIESYQKMIDSTSVTAEQKAIAQNEITKINNTKNAIMITENLIKTKDFKDVVILVNDESVNVIVSSDELKQEEVAQIQNIVSREMKAEIENIHISNR